MTTILAATHPHHAGMSFTISLALALGGLATATLAVALAWGAMPSRRRGRRPGRAAIDNFHYCARFLLGAICLMGGSAVIAALPATAVGAVAPVMMRLAAGPFILVAVSVLPGSDLSRSRRVRVLLDGIMIGTGAATFIWYFLMGPALLSHWNTLDQAIIALGYPGLDFLLVAALLVLSAKSRRLAVQLWAPLAGGTVLVIVADCLRELWLNSPSSVGAVAGFIRFAAMLLVSISAIQLARSDGKNGVRSGEADPRETTLKSASETRWSERIWNSLLPYALVPATAALAVYAWQQNYDSTITTGVVLGTTILVTLTFVRQLLAAKENHQLFQEAADAYQQSLAYAENMEQLYRELRRAKEQLQENNGLLAKANQQLHDQASTDPLTTLPNHRAMVAALDHELDRAARYGRPCSLIFLDLDHFKALNDTRGHLCGDSVLREIVHPIRQGLRAQDVAGRWGGEEFVILLPETDLNDAMAAAERVRGEVSGHAFSAVAGAHLTCSIGVASYPVDASDRDALIDAADKAMYAAKRLGKNQVRSATDPSALAIHSEFHGGSTREDTTTWGVVEALTALVRANNPDADAESVRVADLAMRVATTLRLPASEVRTVGLAARLHDLGLVSSSAPNGDAHDAGTHAILGADIVDRIPSLAMLGPIIRSHHERWDGTGYPDRLHGSEIPLGARILAACEEFTKWTRGRQLPVSVALSEVQAQSGRELDPKVVAALQTTLGSLTEPMALAG